MKNFLPALVIVVSAILALMVLGGVAQLSTYSSVPTDFTPGDSVVVLTGEGLIIDGEPCQGNIHAFVSPVSVEKEQVWYRPESYFWPTDTEISVIYDNGSIEWVKMKSLVTLPAEEALLLCPSSKY